MQVEVAFLGDGGDSEGEPDRVIPGLLARPCPFSDMPEGWWGPPGSCSRGCPFSRSSYAVSDLDQCAKVVVLTSIPPLRSIWIHKRRHPRLASSQRGSLDDRAAGWLPCLVLVLMRVLEAGRMFLFLASTGYRVQADLPKSIGDYQINRMIWGRFIPSYRSGSRKVQMESSPRESSGSRSLVVSFDTYIVCSPPCQEACSLGEVECGKKTPGRITDRRCPTLTPTQACRYFDQSTCREANDSCRKEGHSQLLKWIASTARLVYPMMDTMF